MARQVPIPNPVLNSPFAAPSRHWKPDGDVVTDEVVEGRRESAYFVPIAPSRKQPKQLALAAPGLQEQRRENVEINRIRALVKRWRDGGYGGETQVTRRLLRHWTAPERERRLFFCQVEAAETAIYLAEIAPKHSGGEWIEGFLKEQNEAINPGLWRVAFKMATGSGKTAVMAMLIAWQTLNKLAAPPRDAHFTDAFLVVCPGITIRDRLRVLLPTDPTNEYTQRDLVPTEMREQLARAKVVVTNFHAFLQRERSPATKLTKRILAGREAPDDAASPFQESPAQMVRRVCRDLGVKSRAIVVINDEAHHCYEPRPAPEEEGNADAGAFPLSREERREQERRAREARVWTSGLRAVQAELGIKAIYDLSATPFFLRGSGYREGQLFPWVVSDFSLIDAIESGIVKVPRVPVSDDSMTGDQPTYRNLWPRIRDALPKKGRGTDALAGEPTLPKELEGALESLYGNYCKYHASWEQERAKSGGDEMPPPVFIVVCNNTNVSKLVFDWISGWDKPLKGGKTVPVPGKLKLFSNVVDGRWAKSPPTILIDSEQLESGEALSDDFKKVAATEIGEWKDEYRRRFPGRDTDALTDADLLREVLNTVGKPGKLGERVKCVVSVSMLTEGWDASTVTHILGVRAFGTQLLCEQVVGRGLRRRSYVEEPDHTFRPEYAEVYGVPFTFLPCAGSSPEPRPPTPTRRVCAVSPERDACAISFPRLTGYQWEFPTERLTAVFDERSRLVLTTRDLPTRVDNAPVVGEVAVHTLDAIRAKREQTVDFALAKHLLESRFRDGNGEVKQWLFPQLLRLCRQWREECLELGDNTFAQLLTLAELRDRATERIYSAIVSSTAGDKVLKPIPQRFDPVGSTRGVDFETTRSVFDTRPDKCHLNRVVADTGSWEQKMAEALEDMDEVVAYVKNQNLGFAIPYVVGGEQKQYVPDFIARVRDGGEGELNLIIEVSGAAREDKQVKVTTARTFWVPAVNNARVFGRWGFIEVPDPWHGKKIIRDELKRARLSGAGA